MEASLSCLLHLWDLSNFLIWHDVPGSCFKSPHSTQNRPSSTETLLLVLGNERPQMVARDAHCCTVSHCFYIVSEDKTKKCVFFKEKLYCEFIFLIYCEFQFKFRRMRFLPNLIDLAFVSCFSHAKTCFQWWLCKSSFAFPPTKRQQSHSSRITVLPYSINPQTI